MRSNERDRLNTVARFKKGFLRKKWGQVHSLRNIRVGPDPIFLRHLFTLKYYLLSPSCVDWGVFFLENNDAYAVQDIG